MPNKYQSKLLFWIKAAFIGAFLPLLLSYQSWAKDCEETEIDSKIEQFQHAKKAKTALDAVVLCGEKAIAPLERALSNRETAIRANAAFALGKIKEKAQDAAPALVLALEDDEEAVLTQATSALSQIGEAAQQQEIHPWDVNTVHNLKTLQQNLADAQKKLEKDRKNWASKKNDIGELKRVSNGLLNKLESLEDEQLYQIVQWLRVNQWAWVAVGYVAGYLSIFIFQPLLLLELDKWVKPASFTIPWFNLQVSLGGFLILKYHPRVLDRWVDKHFEEVKSHFLGQRTVDYRRIHIPIQIKLNSTPLDQLAPQHLRSTFNQSPICLFIVGEGGIGKTSLAYQIARWVLKLSGEGEAKGESPSSHPMLPVLIEKELENTSLLTAIQIKLPRTEKGDFIDTKLLKALLKQQRVLVILDHISEMSDSSYNQMQEELTKISVNALLITSRLKEKDLGCARKTWLEPQKIEGTRLSNFIQPYLVATGNKDIFEDDAEFYRTCTRLSTMMSATLQSATALLVRMYVDQIIEAEGLTTALLPDDIPTMMVKYLEWLNRAEAINNSVRQDDSVVLQAASAIAWICLRDNYYPREVRYEDTLYAISNLSQTKTLGQEPKDCLNYLQNTLQLIQREANSVKIILDPVAEYLAALKVVAVCQQREGEEPWKEFFKPLETELEQEIREPWKRFLQTVDAKPDLDQIHGFLLAVFNCCCHEGKKLPEGVLEKLEQRAKLDPQKLEQVRRRQRINRLIDELYYAESKYLGQAIRNLRDEGAYAHKAIPDLLKVLKSDKDKIEGALRVEALNALMKIEVDAEKRDALCREVLAERSDAPEVRVAAIKALLQLGRQSETLEELLNSYFQEETEVGVVRVQAGEGLRKLGVLQKLLVVELSEDATPTIHLLPTPEPWVMELAEGIELLMVPIPGGTFGMGSPSGEGYDDERPQHQVTVPDFFMGQFPVTQAQYEAVMGYNNPSTFSTNGSNRPVETVSWDDAVDFCQRLSQLTGQEFRLPSEAEWEYACRAGRTTPFYFGETITTDCANYRGTDRNYGAKVYSGSYGRGPKGISRQETIEVGSFPANAFGLYDMHGNVWEWCQDDWHKNYEGAPKDGKAWVSGTRSEKVLRGGSWSNGPSDCRSASRCDGRRNVPTGLIGFRVVCVAPSTT